MAFRLPRTASCKSTRSRRRTHQHTPRPRMSVRAETLAAARADKDTVFGIDVPGPLAWRNAVAANRMSGFPTMEQMAAPYAAALGTHTPSSPCVLAGHSFAGLMAFEVAHQFVRQGGKVEM